MTCRFSDITDDDLEHIIMDIKESMPEIGERMTMGALRSRGLTVPRHRVHQCFIKWTQLVLLFDGIPKLNVSHTQYQDQIHYGILVRILILLIINCFINEILYYPLR